MTTNKASKSRHDDRPLRYENGCKFMIPPTDARAGDERELLPLLPMPWRRWPLGLAATFTRSEVVAIKQGFMPQDMDDRWRIRSQGDWVYFHRSWTGSCIYSLQLCAQNNAYAIRRSWVNRNRSEYRGQPIELERETCRSLIDRLLLNRS